MQQKSTPSKNTKAPEVKPVRNITLDELSLISGGIATRPTWPPVVRPK